MDIVNNLYEEFGITIMFFSGFFFGIIVSSVGCCLEVLTNVIIKKVKNEGKR